MSLPILIIAGLAIQIIVMITVVFIVRFVIHKTAVRKKKKEERR